MKQKIEQVLYSRTSHIAAMNQDRDQLKKQVIAGGSRISAAEAAFAASQAELEKAKKKEIELQSQLKYTESEEAQMVEEYQKLQRQRAEAIAIEEQLEAALKAARQSGESGKIAQLEQEKAELSKKLKRIQEADAEGSTMTSILAKSHEENMQLTRELLAMKEEVDTLLAQKNVTA